MNKNFILRGKFYPIFSLILLKEKPKVLLLDDQRIFIPKETNYWLQNDYIRNKTDGIAIHWYWDHYTDPEGIILFNYTAQYLKYILILNNQEYHVGAYIIKNKSLSFRI